MQLQGPSRGGEALSAVVMCDDHSMRYCKAFLRRRLAYGPQVLERERAVSHPDGEEQGASAWGHLWPLGRHTQCEELRRVRYKAACILVSEFVGVLVCRSLATAVFEIVFKIQNRLLLYEE